VCVCVCACMYSRERDAYERCEGGGQREGVCVCVCVEDKLLPTIGKPLTQHRATDRHADDQDKHQLDVCPFLLP